MHSIPEFKTFDTAFTQAKSWAKLIGRSYSGGGGGVGKVAHNSVCKLEIYSQAYDGATNYHGCPNADMQAALNDALGVQANKIIAEALAIMAVKHQNLARSATAEAQAILDIAGGVCGVTPTPITEHPNSEGQL